MKQPVAVKKRPSRLQMNKQTHMMMNEQFGTREELWCEIFKLRQMVGERDSTISQLNNIIISMQRVNKHS